MNNEKSYTEMMKSLARKKKVIDTVSMLDVYIEMVIDESLFKRQKELLETNINTALDQRDEIAFYELSAQYHSLLQTST
ncbi:IDEAL domain-containing protein [Priestia megaterium]|uniref:IDEAL domain-containing protein n=1 Tax=Priestia megaterium TaxID=1404 RepID=UPI00203AFEFF|nr:IDEAL domain-containing protein [Priestia megaterium]MCM3546502.1 IDEAL domain-containing protein [Priestia megaterium]